MSCSDIYSEIVLYQQCKGVLVKTPQYALLPSITMSRLKGRPLYSPRRGPPSYPDQDLPYVFKAKFTDTNINPMHDRDTHA